MQTEAPGPLGRFGNAYSSAAHDCRSFTGGSNEKRGFRQTQAVVHIGYSKRPCEPPGSRAEISLRPSPHDHLIDADLRGYRADQNGAMALRNDIETPMQAVGAVDIGV